LFRGFVKRLRKSRLGLGFGFDGIIPPGPQFGPPPGCGLAGMYWIVFGALALMWTLAPPE
jgi:hypothetical protein